MDQLRLKQFRIYFDFNYKECFGKLKRRRVFICKKHFLTFRVQCQLFY